MSVFLAALANLVCHGPLPPDLALFLSVATGVVAMAVALVSANLRSDRTGTSRPVFRVATRAGLVALFCLSLQLAFFVGLAAYTLLFF